MVSHFLNNEYLGLNPVNIKYVDFGAGNIYVTINDLSQNLSFIYDKQGNLLTTPPLESEIAEVSDNGSKKPKIFSAYKTSLTVQSVP
jgi:hypothetical protein